MSAFIRSVWQTLLGPGSEVAKTPAITRPRRTEVPEFEIAPNDPLLAYLQSHPGVIEVNRLNLDSPALAALKAAGVKLAVPLVSQHELIGLINLGPRLSEQEYSSDDRRLLNDLSSQAAPLVRVAQLIRQQQIEARKRERLEQELRVARIIQQTLLPKELPDLPGWRVAVHWQPAQAVGGDFYDFLELPDGRLALIVGDVTDKGVPAALVMASTRTILRAAAERLISPGVVLERANDAIYPDMPAKMFVTCLYAVLDPASGQLQYANAGHNLPYRKTERGLEEMRATGMPLGLMPGMKYEEKGVMLSPGESVLLYSDGLVEAHNPQREMFGFPRLQRLMAAHPGGAALIDHLLSELATFTGPEWEQEDDVTFVTLEYAARSESEDDVASQTLADFTVPSEQGNERQAIQRVAEVAQELGLPPARLERLKTAVAEAVMNAMEHGNRYEVDLPVHVQVIASPAAVEVRITDRGYGQPIPEPEMPDLEAKLAGEQSPRGWGLFLIKNMVDDMRVTADESHHTVELIMHLKGAIDASPTT